MDDSPLPSLLKSSALVFAGFACQSLLTFLATVLLARWLGVSAFGLVELGHTILLFISTFVLLGIHNGISRYLPRFDSETDRRGLLVSAYQIGLVTALVVASVLFLFASVIARKLLHVPSAVPIIQMFAVALPFIILLRLSVGTIRGLELTYPRVLSQNIVLPISRFLGIAILAIVGAQTEAFAGAYTVSYVLAAILAFYFVVTRSSLLDRSIPAPSTYQRLLQFSVPVLVAGLMFSVLARIDVLLLSYLTGTSNTVGIYRAVYPLARLLVLALLSFNFLILPILSKLDADGNHAEVQRIYTTVTKWVLVVTLPVCLVFIAYPHPVILYTYGAEYVSGAPALRILAAGFLVQAVAGPNGNALQSLGYVRTLMVDNIFIATLNVGLNILLIPLYGVTGAAIATTVSFFVLNGIMALQLYSKASLVPVSTDALWLTGVSIPVFVLLVLFTKWASLTGLLAVLSVSLAFGGLYLFLAIRYTVGPTEIELITRAEDRLDVNLTVLKSILKANDEI